MRVTRTTLRAPSPDVARGLLGARIVSTLGGVRVAVRLTEIEAYAGMGADPASHAHRGRTSRNATMFGGPGLLYVYFTYGMHWCANVVCGPDGTASAVLLRAGEVVDGEAAAFERRPAARRSVDLARGPARLAAALGINGAHDGLDLLDAGSTVRLVGGVPVPSSRINEGRRTGVSGAGAVTPWRFWIDGEPSVSPYRPARPRATG